MIIEPLLRNFHFVSVASYCYLICKKLKLDYVSATRAAMLHDLFLYDWRKRQDGRKGLHAFTHGKTACENACKLFDLNEKEKDIITKHMWPVTIKLPKSPEAFILTLVDKYCAICETNEVYQNRILSKKITRYTYIMLCLLIFHI
ncbi:MAG: HD family phosphohydrolase [Clostridia bacterium]|nr:HD family phosphohydrolase [Clostridia bacterium]